MNAAMIQYLWRYMIHADQQIMSAADTVADENWDRDFAISAGSLRKLLEHNIGAQSRWLVRMGATGVENLADLPRPQIRPAWDQVHSRLAAFAAAKTDATLDQLVHSQDRHGNAFSIPLGLCMLHVADHATYHRGQINSVIKLAGGTPSPVMLFTYAKSNGI